MTQVRRASRMVAAQSNLVGARHFWLKLFMKNWQNARILHDICPENARILHYVCPKKNIFRDFFGGRGVVREGNPIAPISYTYGWAPGPPPAKSGPAWTIHVCHIITSTLLSHICYTTWRCETQVMNDTLPI